MFPLISEKAVEEAVRNCEQLKRREQEEDNVTIEELEKQRVEALEVVEKEMEMCLLRVEDRVKLHPHSLHKYGFSPMTCDTV